MANAEGTDREVVYVLSRPAKVVYWLIAVVLLVTVMANNNMTLVGTPFEVAGAAGALFLIFAFVLDGPVKRRFGTPKHELE